MDETIAWGDDHHFAEQSRPVVDRTIGGDDGRGFFVTAHQHVGEFVAGVGGQSAQDYVVNEQ